jgi:septum formation protein
MQTIVLGSSSITRAELLTRFGVPFIQRDAGFDEESLRINDPAHFVYHATKGKMQVNPPRPLVFVAVYF